MNLAPSAGGDGDGDLTDDDDARHQTVACRKGEFTGRNRFSRNVHRLLDGIDRSLAS